MFRDFLPHNSLGAPMMAARLLSRGPLHRGAQVLRGGVLSCSRPTVQPWKSLRQFGSCTRPPTMARRAPRPTLGGASTQPWRLAGGSARARMLCTPAQPAAAEGGAAMLKSALNWAGENRTVVGVLLGAVLVMYGFYRGSVRLMKFFFNVSDKQIFQMGFVVGLISAAGIIVAGVVTHRHLNLHIDDVRPQPTRLTTASPPARAHRLTSPRSPPHQSRSPLASAGLPRRRQASSQAR